MAQNHPASPASSDLPPVPTVRSVLAPMCLELANALGAADVAILRAQNAQVRLNGFLRLLLEANETIASSAPDAHGGAPPPAAAPATGGLDVVASRLTAACAAAGPFDLPSAKRGPVPDDGPAR